MAGAYEGFGGEVGRVFATSTPWWPPPPVAPEGAPNVVVVLCDDVGFSDIGCYGSEIPTPNLDRLAAEALRYTNYHATPMCSPSRAALLTGVNPHRAGVGHVAHADPGFPGYAMELAGDVATMAEILRDNGYATLMVGKWHLAKDSHLSDAGPRHAWPLQRGFDRYYGLLDGFTNYHHPHRLVEDNHTVPVDRYPNGYYLTDDLTARAIDMVRGVRAANPAKPFFLYLAHGAAHAPLQAKAQDMAAQRGRYDAGWDVVREQRHRRQQELGIIAPGTVLPPRNSESRHAVRAWEDVPAAQQRLYARYTEIFAAMVASIDESFGRLRAALEELGVWEDTIVLFTSDNGASREGEEHGTSSYFRTLNLLLPDPVEDDLARLDLLGSPRALAHYPRGWAMVSNTPFRLYKQNTHAGGHAVPFILSWPGRVPAGELRNQYTYITDVLPTLLELTGIEPPTARNGVTLKPMDGRSFAATIDDESVPSAHREQMVELGGNRAFYRDGWEAVTLHQPNTAFRDDRWELYDLARDPTQTDDRAERDPERLAELVAAWEEHAWANQVFPLDEGTALKFLLRPPGDGVFERAVTLLPGTPTLERYRSLRLMHMRSFTVTARLDHGAADQGMLVAHGDQGGGYALYVRGGELVYAHNGYGAMRTSSAGGLAAGAQEVVLEVEAPGQQRWTVRVSVDGVEVACDEGFPMLMAMAPFEGIDVGIDRRSPVSWEIYEAHGPFPYTGALQSVTYTPGPPAPDSGELFVDLLKTIGARYE